MKIVCTPDGAIVAIPESIRERELLLIRAMNAECPCVIHLLSANYRDRIIQGSFR